MIEIMTFRLRPDTEREAFIAADAVVQAEFSYQQPGIVRRTIASADDGTWLVHTIWGSAAAAEAATRAALGSAIYADFVAMIDETTIEVSRYTPAGAA